jgi:hypothetical protein
MKTISGAIIMVIVSIFGLLALSCNTPYETGTIEGKIWIGPLEGGPPEKVGQPYPAEIYQPRKIMVYDADHKELIKQVNITEKGYFSVELPADTYTIDINYIGSDRSNAVPMRLTLKPGMHLMLDIDFNTGADLNVIPSPGGYLVNSLNQSSEVMLKAVHINTNYSDKTYFSPWYPLHTVNAGEYILEVSGNIQNNHPQNKEIAMYAEGYDDTGKQVAWTLDAAHIAGQIGLHLEKGETTKFTLHLNFTASTKSIRIFANNYNLTPP